MTIENVRLQHLKCRVLENLGFILTFLVGVAMMFLGYIGDTISAIPLTAAFALFVFGLITALVGLILPFILRH